MPFDTRRRVMLSSPSRSEGVSKHFCGATQGDTTKAELPAGSLAPVIPNARRQTVLLIFPVASSSGTQFGGDTAHTHLRASVLPPQSQRQAWRAPRGPLQTFR